MLHDNAKGYRYEPTRRHERPARARTPRRVAGARSVSAGVCHQRAVRGVVRALARCLRTVVRGGGRAGRRGRAGPRHRVPHVERHLPRRHRQPLRFRAVAVIVLVQQAIGLAGESWLRFGLPAGHAALSASIERFILFDAAGLVLMAAAFGWLLWVKRATPQT